MKILPSDPGIETCSNQYLRSHEANDDQDGAEGDSDALRQWLHQYGKEQQHHKKQYGKRYIHPNPTRL